MRRRQIQMGAPIGSGRLLDLTKSHGADQHAIALEECKIGGDYEFRLTQ